MNRSETYQKQQHNEHKDSLSKAAQFFQLALVTNCNLIGRDDKWKGGALALFGIQWSLHHSFSLRSCSVVPDHGSNWKPLFEFPHPIGKCCQWGDDQEWATDSLSQQMRNQSDHLNCFSKSHLPMCFQDQKSEY